MWPAFHNSIVWWNYVAEWIVGNWCEIDKFEELIKSIEAFLQLVIGLPAIDPTTNYLEPKLSIPIFQLWFCEEALKLLLWEVFPNPWHRKCPIDIDRYFGNTCIKHWDVWRGGRQAQNRSDMLNGQTKQGLGLQIWQMHHIPVYYELTWPVGQGFALELYSKGVSPTGRCPC